MTRANLEKLIEQNARPENSSVSTETGLQAADIVAHAAASEQTECALAGGLAMHLYGFARATTDVDFVASKRLPLDAQRELSFGGASYSVTVGGRAVTIDWIVRADEYAAFYRAALADAVVLANNRRVLTPEWLVILKYIAGRGKDEIDLIWLLQQPGLVDRKSVRQHLISVGGEVTGKIVYRELARRYFSLAGGEGDENESYRSAQNYQNDK